MTGLNAPTKAGRISDGSTSSESSISITISDLLPNETYYIRTYAINPVGIGYSEQSTITTLTTTPALVTMSPTAITSSSANGGGNITNNGGADVTVRGVCWSTSQNPTIADNKTTDGSGTGSFISMITGLTASTTYYIRTYATNSNGTSYGNLTTITTLAPSLPVLTTMGLNDITSTFARGGGIITDDGGSTITARGVCWSTNTNPKVSDNKTTEGTGTGSFTSSISGLTFAVIYYFRAYATNSVGTTYGNWVTNNMTGLPVITTDSISSITSTSATIVGKITSDGSRSGDDNTNGSPVTARGVCWGTTQNLTIANSKTTDGTGIGRFVSNLTGLTPNTSYYVRAYATNSRGTNYGNVAGFFTSQLNCPSCEIIQIKYGTSFNNCIGYCKKDLILSPGVTNFTKQGFSGTPAPVSCTVILDSNSWNSIKTGMSISSFFNLPLTIGCPDCADGGAEWIEMYLSNGDIHKVKFEYNNVPAILKNYSTLLRSLMVNAGNNCP